MSSTAPIIAIHFDDPEPMGYPFTSKWYWESYRWFSDLCASKGVAVYFVRGRKLPLTSLTFKKGWQFQKGKIVAVESTFTADLLYLKGERVAPVTDPKSLVINHIDFDNLCLNKLATHAVLGPLMALSFPLTKDTWREAMAQLPGERVVIKPVDGYGGAEVEVIAKADFAGDRFFRSKQQYLVEEFVDTSAGIPGIVGGTHDLRILMFSGTPTLSYIRTPKEGSLIANLALGGKITPLEIDRVPPEVLAIAQSVDAKFNHFYPRVYSIDFMIGKERPVVCELNSRPGFPHPDFVGQSFTDTFHQRLLETMLEAITTRSQAKPA